MPPQVEQHRQDIEALCRAYGGKRLELFGSGARGDFKAAESDLDFIVEFQSPDWQGLIKRFMGLKLALEELLRRPVDLVQLHAGTNPHFTEVASRHRQTLYAA